MLGLLVGRGGGPELVVFNSPPLLDVVFEPFVDLAKNVPRADDDDDFCPPLLLLLVPLVPFAMRRGFVDADEDDEDEDDDDDEEEDDDEDDDDDVVVISNRLDASASVICQVTLFCALKCSVLGLCALLLLFCFVFDLKKRFQYV